MTLEEKINQDIKTAMKNKDSGRLRALRAIKNAIIMSNTDGSGQEMDEALEMKLLQKLIKQRKESLEIYEQQNREDLAAVEREEIETIETYLPEQLSEEEVKSELEKIIDQLGASGMQDMGKVMANANKTLAGKADGKMMAKVAKELLGG